MGRALFRRMSKRCKCSDPACPVSHGDFEVTHQCGRQASILLYRVDMEDETGTLMCDGCSEDAMASGLFTMEDEGDE